MRARVYNKPALHAVRVLRGGSGPGTAAAAGKVADCLGYSLFKKRARCSRRSSAVDGAVPPGRGWVRVAEVGGQHSLYTLARAPARQRGAKGASAPSLWSCARLNT
jgi:hypothetical protein